MAIAATRLAWEAVGGGAVSPRLVIVGRETGLTVPPLGVVLTLTDRLQFSAAATGMAIACTPADREDTMLPGLWIYPQSGSEKLSMDGCIRVLCGANSI